MDPPPLVAEGGGQLKGVSLNSLLLAEGDDNIVNDDGNSNANGLHDGTGEYSVVQRQGRAAEIFLQETAQQKQGEDEEEGEAAPQQQDDGAQVSKDQAFKILAKMVMQQTNLDFTRAFLLTYKNFKGQNDLCGIWKKLYPFIHIPFVSRFPPFHRCNPFFSICVIIP